MGEDSKVKRLRDLFLTQSDVAGWVVLVFGFGLFYARGDVIPWPCVSMVFLGLLSIVGADIVRGIKIGPGGIEGGEQVVKGG